MINWRDASVEKPTDGQECLFRYKHGYISGTYDAASNSGFSYVWQDVEYWFSKWVPIEEVECSH